ncbi:LuxR C-terminal-related transcriptional regulator [Micromonospora sp. NBC_01796]|uniref:LuxR C-terminal-related transcriptional regulator n=1 Tax=Micromonospora sp. NBC_01796 TaxID=2975987 RepID=UPI002DD8C92F|nr:LuxR C-terminal-related transcriptional regulator [Micromonospora sp. NBC_01796]WSA87389.1 helix-turn-helix transcriptional regulator [Micromonospora sp. NBC_01796]
MPESTDTIPRLTRWGVSPDADLIYRALTMMGGRKDTELSRELGLPRSRVVAALDELAALRAAQPTRSATIRSGVARRWDPCPVPQVLRHLRRPAVPGSQRDRWRQHFGTLDGLDLPTPDDSRIRRWTTRSLARRRIAHLGAAERHEHLAINTEEVITADATAAALPVDRGLVERGIQIRILGRPPGDGDRTTAHLAQVGGGLTYRELPDLPIKLIVFDRRVALFPADPLNFEAGVVEVDDAPVVQALCGLFDRLWTQGRDPHRQGVPPITLTPREQALVALLSAGHTDVSAAHELKLSVRTVAYTMRELMDRLGVENRFQLALLLGAAGAAPLPMSRTAVPQPTEQQDKDDG